MDSGQAKSKSTEREISTPEPRTFFRSKWWTAIDDCDGKRMVAHSRTYIRPKREGEIKGKLNIKAAKRARVKAWKAEKALA